MALLDWLTYTIRNVAGSSAYFVLLVHPAETQEHEGDYSRERVLEELGEGGCPFRRA